MIKIAISNTKKFSWKIQRHADTIKFVSNGLDMIQRGNASPEFAQNLISKVINAIDIGEDEKRILIDKINSISEVAGFAVSAQVQKMRMSREPAVDFNNEVNILCKALEEGGNVSRIYVQKLSSKIVGAYNDGIISNDELENMRARIKSSWEAGQAKKQLS